MYKHILLPVDGSDFGMGAISDAVSFAKSVGASLSAITVSIPYSVAIPGPLAGHFPEEAYNKSTHETATAILRKVEAAATAAGVPFKAYHARNAHPWEAIINAAEDHGCDLIFMASHGRRGIADVLIGSETKRVVTHTTIPVLVWRA